MGLAAGFGLRSEQTIKPAEIPQAPIEARADTILSFIWHQFVKDSPEHQATGVLYVYTNEYIYI